MHFILKSEIIFSVVIHLLEFGIFRFPDCCLHLVESLLDECAILNVEDSISIALNFRIMSDHDASCSSVLTIAVWANPIDIQEKVHDSHSRPRVQVTCGLIK